MGYATFAGSLKWPRAQVPYTIDGGSFPPGSPELAVITNAVNSWNTAAGLVRMVQRTNEVDYVAFVPDETVTASYVGRRGGRQEVQAAYFPNIPPGASVAAVAQGVAQVDCLYFDNAGTLRVSWVPGAAGSWQGPVGLTPPRTAPAGAALVAFAQSADQVDVAFVDGNGVVNVMWVSAGNPAWQGPVGLTGPRAAPPGAPLAALGQFGDQHDLLFVDANGVVNVMWVSAGNPTWQGPVGLTLPRTAPAAAPLVAFAQSADQVDVAFVDANGVVNVMWVTAGNPAWQGPVGLTPPATAPAGAPLRAGWNPSAQLDLYCVDRLGSVRIIPIAATGSVGTITAPLVVGVDTSPTLHSDFVHWTSASASGASGTLNGSTVSLEGPMGTAFYLHDDYPGFSGPPYSPALATTGMVELASGAGHHYTLTFGSPVDDVVLHLGSLSSVMTFHSGTTITRVSGDENFSVRDNAVIGQAVGGNGTIRLRDQLQTLTFELRPNFGDGTGHDGVFLQVGGTT